MNKITKPVSDVGKELINGVGSIGKELINGVGTIGKDVIGGVGSVAKEKFQNICIAIVINHKRNISFYKQKREMKNFHFSFLLLLN